MTMKTLWRLQVEAEVPGVDYSSQFEVPVFKTAESREAQAPRTHPMFGGRKSHRLSI